MNLQITILLAAAMKMLKAIQAAHEISQICLALLLTEVWEITRKLSRKVFSIFVFLSNLESTADYFSLYSFQPSRVTGFCIANSISYFHSLGFNTGVADSLYTLFFVSPAYMRSIFSLSSFFLCSSRLMQGFSANFFISVELSQFSLYYVSGHISLPLHILYNNILLEPFLSHSMLSDFSICLMPPLLLGGLLSQDI